jgi:hypothetical protein
MSTDFTLPRERRMDHLVDEVTYAADTLVT